MARARMILLIASGIGLLVFTSSFQINGQESVQPIPVESKPDLKPRKELRTYMHSKLVHSADVFEGLVRRDFEQVRTAAEALKVTTLGSPEVAPGKNRDDEVFEHFRLEFVRQAARLEQLAEAENLEGAAYIAQQLNATCISCHQYLRDWEKPGSPREARKNK